MKINIKPTRSYVVHPETGELLTAREWKQMVGDNMKDVLLIAVVPGDGSPAFCFPKNHIGEKPWKEAMKAAEGYAPEGTALPRGAEGSWLLPTRKQGIYIRDARSAGLDQLLEQVGGDDLNEWYWTREPWIARGTSEEEFEKIAHAWSASRYSAYSAWCFGGYGGYASYYYVYYANRALPVLLLDPVCVPDADA